MTTETLNMLPMQTNEQGRIDADRRIPLNVYDIFYEFLGNMDDWMLRERPQQLPRYNQLKSDYLNSQYDPNNPASM